MGKDWYREKKSETWYKKAKQEGYRARSAFKLKQIHEKYRVIRPGDTVVDLGASPGGWSQVAVELVGPTGRVVGVDLVRTPPMGGAVFVQGDITTKETADEVLGILAKSTKGPRVDVVVSDMSPKLTGNYTMDQANSVWLCHHALEFARRVLDAGGRFVVKVFEGEDYQEFLQQMKASFHDVRPYNPPASRKQSSEIYLIGIGFRSPSRAERAPQKPASTSHPS